MDIWSGAAGPGAIEINFKSISPARFAGYGALLLSVATKVSKNARRAAPPGAARRVPCVSHGQRPAPNSLPYGRSDMRSRKAPLAAAILGGADGNGQCSVSGFRFATCTGPDVARTNFQLQARNPRSPAICVEAAEKHSLRRRLS